MTKGFSDFEAGKDYGDWGVDREVWRNHKCRDCSALDGIRVHADFQVLETGNYLCYDHLIERGYTPTHARVRRA